VHYTIYSMRSNHSIVLLTVIAVALASANGIFAN
jgi:hypothetical protein